MIVAAVAPSMVVEAAVMDARLNISMKVTGRTNGRTAGGPVNDRPDFLFFCGLVRGLV